MLDPTVSTGADPVEESRAFIEENNELREQVSTLEELLQVYEESAIEQERRLKGMLNDLDEKTQLLEHAEEALQTLHSILDSMGDAVIVANADGHPLFVNPAAHQLLENRLPDASVSLDATELDATESNITELDTTAQHNRGRSKTSQSKIDRSKTDRGKTTHLLDCSLIDYSPITRALQGELVDAAEIQLQAPESRPSQSHHSQWLSVNARPITAETAAEAKTITGAVAVFRDITQRKQTEQDLQRSHEAAQKQTTVLENTLHQLKQTQAQLIHGEKMASLGQTVAGIAHEINNPVSFIHGNLKHTAEAFNDLLSLIALFQTTYSDLPASITQRIDDIDLAFLAEDIPRMIVSMETGTCRIREIVKSLRVFSRLDEADLKAVNVDQGIDSAVMLVQAKLENHPQRPDITLQRQYDTCPPLSCYASQLNQVFVHLLSNAIDALETTTKAPKIIIRTQASEAALTVEIEDNGQGISPDVQAKMFDPFFTTKPVGKGTGLGLAMCHQIITETHKGAISCLSKVNQGTCMKVVIPYGLRD